MNARGLTELIALSVGLQIGLLDRELYSEMVVMAVVTTVMTGPRWFVRADDRMPMRKEQEQKRAGPGAQAPVARTASGPVSPGAGGD